MPFFVLVLIPDHYPHKHLVTDLKSLLREIGGLSADIANDELVRTGSTGIIENKPDIFGSIESLAEIKRAWARLSAQV